MDTPWIRPGYVLSRIQKNRIRIASDTSIRHAWGAYLRETAGRREEVRGGGAAAGGWAPSTAAEARHSACASRRRAAGWPRRQRGADRELAGGAAVRRTPDLGLPSLAALALLSSPEREGGRAPSGSARRWPEAVAGGWAPRPRARWPPPPPAAPATREGEGERSRAEEGVREGREGERRPAAVCGWRR